MATVRNYRGRWVADYRDALKRRHIESPRGPFESKALEKRAAQELLAKRQAEISANTYIAPNMEMRFADLCTQFLASKRAVRRVTTLFDYEQVIRAYLVPMFGHMRLREITPATVERYKGELLGGLPERVRLARVQRVAAIKEAGLRQHVGVLKPGPRTVNKSLTVLHTILGYAERMELVVRNPVRGIERAACNQRKARILTPQQLRAVIDHAPEGFRLPIMFAVFTGCRSGEIRALSWADVDLTRREARICRGHRYGQFTPTKTGREKVAELPDELVTALKPWALACPKATGLVFPNRRNNGPLQGKRLLDAFQRAVKDAGIPAGVRLHDARHTFVTLLLADGSPAADVAKAAGHSTPSTTMRYYAHAMPVERLGSSDRLAAFTRGEVVQLSRADGNKMETSGEKVAGGGGNAS